MGAWAPVVGVIGVVLVIGTTLVLRGPVGRALAEWIRSWSAHDAQWLADVEERLGFGEGFLAPARAADVSGYSRASVRGGGPPATARSFRGGTTDYSPTTA